MTERGQKVLTAAIVIACIAAAAFFVAVTIAVLQLRADLNEIANRVDVTLDRASDVENALLERVKELQHPIAQVSEMETHAIGVEEAVQVQVNALHPILLNATDVTAKAGAAIEMVQQKTAETLDTVNRPCGGGLPCGTLAEANELMRRGTDVITTTQINENKETALLDDRLTPLLTHADVALEHMDAVTGDVQFEVDKFVHPAKKKLGFWGSIYAGAVTAHRFMPPIF